MRRFWIFPLICAVTGAFVIPVSRWQSWVLLELQPSEFLDANVWDIKTFSSTKTVAIGAALGGLWGFVIAACGMWRHRTRGSHNASSTKRLLLNLVWCGIYVSLLVVSGAWVFAFLESRFASRAEPLFLWLESALACLPFVANASAIVWATTRTITQTDVPSPRVFGSKWKGSSTLESRGPD